jgi:predicted dehydrogenase
VTAICSRDPKKRAGDWRGIQGNFGPPGEKLKLKGVKGYEHLDEMLADPDIDLIDVCNPTHLHPQTAIKALQAGKHVLVEKAIALQPQEADQMLNAARAAGKLFMVAHVLPFVPEFAHAAQTIREGTHGKLLAAHFERVISKPDWSSDIGDASKTGGPAVDLHIHDTHFIGLVAGVPGRVFSTGVVENDTVVHLTTQYLYGSGGPCISCTSGALAMKGRPFIHAFEIFLEKATLLYRLGATPLTLLTAKGKAKKVKLKGADDPIKAFTAELQAAVDGVKKGQEPDLLSAKLARDALVLCYKECESVKTGKAVSIS